jgi:capsular polysaccharide biosynthesis protein/MinD-like ATPase involved in chromosome partitioning or flagellar assembly
MSTLQPIDSPLRHYLQVLKRQAWLVLLVPALTVAVAVAILETQAPTYRASTTLVVGEPRGIQAPVPASGSVTRSMANLFESEVIVRSVIRELDLNVSIQDFRKKFKVSVLPDTSVVKVSYDSTNRRQAVNVVSELSQIFTARLDETLGVRDRVGGTRGRGSFALIVREFDPPHVEPDPVAPNVGTNVIFAGIAGLALGLLLAVAREALDSRIRGRKDAEQVFGAPVVGTLPVGMDRRPPPGVGAGATHKRGDEVRLASLDLLRARLLFSQQGVDGRTILVTSAGPETGQSSVTASVGAALALAGKHVICVDADMRQPRLHRLLGVENEAPGLAGVLSDGVEPEEALRTVELVELTTNGAGPAQAAGRLEVLTAGLPPSPLVGMLTPETLSSLIERLHSLADYVIFDSPPLLAADALPLAIRSDNVLVVARSGRTTKDEAESVVGTLQELGVKRIGVVLTDARPGY